MKVKFWRENEPEALPPIIKISEEALDHITTIVQNCNEEVAWFGIVNQRPIPEGFEDSFSSVIEIEKIIIPNQEANAGTCEIAEDWMVPLLDEGEIDYDDLENLKLWGHSHHNMAVTPSGQDDTELNELISQGDYIIRMIVNKKGEFHISYGSKDDNVIFTDISMVFPENERSELIKQQIKERVKKKAVVTNLQNVYSPTKSNVKSVNTIVNEYHRTMETLDDDGFDYYNNYGNLA